MIGGFGLVAYPASYRVSGVTTFIVNQDGVVYQQDLGPKTSRDRFRHDGVQSGTGLDGGAAKLKRALRCASRGRST